MFFCHSLLFVFKFWIYILGFGFIFCFFDLYVWFWIHILGCFDLYFWLLNWYFGCLNLSGILWVSELILWVSELKRYTLGVWTYTFGCPDGRAAGCLNTQFYTIGPPKGIEVRDFNWIFPKTNVFLFFFPEIWFLGIFGLLGIVKGTFLNFWLFGEKLKFWKLSVQLLPIRSLLGRTAYIF